MDKETMGTVISVQKQWWLKINTKPVRMHALDGAIFPHIIKVQYTVDGKTYIKRKWIGANYPVPAVGSSVTVLYCGEKPGKAKVFLEKVYISMVNKQKSENQTHYLPIGMCFGMSIGTAIGAATDNLATGMCIGMSIGVCIGALLDSKKRKESQEDKEKTDL